MIVWLASYPRSGNTLTRTMLNRTFGVETYSEYNDRYDIGSREDVSASVGHKSYPGRWEDFFPRLAADEAVHVVKTHGPPKDGHPAIYVVRDGRSAMVSERHFFRNRSLAAIKYSLRELVDGASFGGNWSSHLDAWQPLLRPRTLFLRYEEIVEEPGRIVALLGRFLRLSPLAAWRNPFEIQRELLPSFFRTGSDPANLAEWTPRDLGHFWNRHERWMRILGYGTRFTPVEARRPLWRPRSQIVPYDPWRCNRLKLGPEPQPDFATEGFFAYVLHQGQPCRWTTDRLSLTVPLSNRVPAVLEIALWAYGPDSPVTIRANESTVFMGPRSVLMRLGRVPLNNVPKRGDTLELEFITTPFSTAMDQRALGICIRDIALIAQDI